MTKDELKTVRAALMSCEVVDSGRTFDADLLGEAEDIVERAIEQQASPKRLTRADLPKHPYHRGRWCEGEILTLLKWGDEIRGLP